jgi:hypothetical protein
MVKRSKSQAKKDYWKTISPEERSRRSRALALIKSSKMTVKEKSDHAKMMRSKK